MALNNLHPMAGWGWWSRVPRRLWPRCLRRLRRRYESVVDWQRNERPQQLHWLEEGRHVPQITTGHPGEKAQAVGPFWATTPEFSRTLDVFKMWISSSAFLFAARFFWGLWPERGPTWTWPATNFFLRPGRRECPATIRIMWELPRSEMGIVTTI